MLKLIILILLFVLVMVILIGSWNIAAGNTSKYTNGNKRLLAIQKEQDKLVKQSAWAKPPLLNILTTIGNNLVIDQDRENRENEQLLRAGLPYTARQFRAKKLVFLVLGLVATFAFYLIGFIILAPIGIAFSVMLYFKVQEELTKRIKDKNEQLLQCLPPFILSVIASLKNERDIIAIIERYIPFAGVALKSEIEKLVLEMKTGGIVKALYNFEGRMNLSETTRLVNILVNINRGIDQTESLELLSGDMLLVINDNITKQLSKRPDMLKHSAIPAGIIAGVMLLYVLLTSLPNTLKF